MLTSYTYNTILAHYPDRCSLTGLVVFSVLGYLADLRGVDVSDLKMEGSGLAFVVYPEAIARMPGQT